MRRVFSVLIIAIMFSTAFGCAEKPKYADPVESVKADDNRIKAINDNPNLTPAQREWQINRIKGQMAPPGK